MEIRNVENAESLFRLTNPLSIAAQGVIPSPYSQPATTIISRVSLPLMNFAAKIAGAAFVCVLCACANVLDQSAALATAPYTIEDGGRIIIEAEVNDRGPFEFALDTAASIPVIFDEPRTTLELQALEGQEVIIHGAVASGRFPLIRAARISIGPEVWSKARIAAMPRPAQMRSNIDGILGIDFLRRYAVGFSNHYRLVRLYAPGLLRHQSYQGWAAIPLSPQRVGSSAASLYFFNIGILRHQIRSIFDLGAGLNVLNWKAARSIGVMPTTYGFEAGDPVVGIMEATPKVSMLKAEKVTTGNVSWHNEKFAIVDLAIFETLELSDGPAAIVGAGMFTQRDFIIDFVRNRLLVNVAGAEADRVDRVASP